MAKRNIRKTDPETTTAPERRRRTTPADATAAMPKTSRSRRKVESPAAAEPMSASAAVEAPEQLDDVAIPHEHIAVRAYHIYLSRGAQPGDQVADWIAAERELRELVRTAR